MASEIETLPEDYAAAHVYQKEHYDKTNGTCAGDPETSPPWDHRAICNSLADVHARGRYAGSPMLAQAEKEIGELRAEVRRLESRVNSLVSEDWTDEDD